MTGRFAPTPSGRMHIGNVYAMLGAWLSARSRGDRMLMRIEDVDKPRVVAGADQLMMDDLHWLGLDWDGEPMFQSQRTERYEYALECLRSQGVLYPCFCSRADIRAASAPNEGDGFMVYPGTCRRLLHDHPDEVRARLVRGDQHSIRIAMPESAAGEKQRTVPDDSAALSGAVPPEQQGDAGIVDGVACFNDRVYSPQHYDLAREVGDSVIRRADGLFGYQLVVVVDDLDMGVDDIVRGRDLLRSTALQMWIRQCLLAGGRPAFSQARTFAGYGSLARPQRNPRANHRILRLAAASATHSNSLQTRRSAGRFQLGATARQPPGPRAETG